MGNHPPRVDLHVHSFYSDGVLAPEALVERARERGLSAVALTDHDNTAGLDAFAAAGRAAGVQTICGIELAADMDGGEIHLLGLGINPAARPPLLKELALRRLRRLDLILRRLEEAYGIVISPGHPAFAMAETGGVVGRPNVARALVATGAVKTMAEAFSRFLRDGAPGDVRKEMPSAAEAIGLIHETGGRAYLAHPGIEDAERHLDALRAIGLGGVEAYHPRHSGEQTARLLRYAGFHSLAVSGGSDFHAPGPGEEMGVPVVPVDALRYFP